MNGNSLHDLSSSLEQAVQGSAASTVTVYARRRMPSTGVVYAPGFVLTANHTVEQDEGILVSPPGAEPVEAELAGRDPGSDLAVLRLNGAGLPAAQTADGEARVGQLVLAVGRPEPDSLEASLGIVSGTGGPVRTRRGGLLARYIRTDAIGFPGFSGGPLLDVSGRVLGINTSGWGGGMFITIPVSTAWQTAAALAEHGSVRRAYLGVRSQLVEIPAQMSAALGRAQETGLILVSVEADSPAAQAGLQVGDLLVGAGGEPVEEPDDLLFYLSGERIGKVTSLQVLRGGQLINVDVTMGVRPPGSRRVR